MKPTFLFLVAVFAINLTFAQNFQELADTKFSSVEQYKTSETNVLHCANYLLNTAHNKQDQNRANALKFINNWMQGTPNYTFNIDEKVTSLTEGNENLLGLYRACMSKVVIESKAATLSQDVIYSKTEQLLVDYCANRRNKLKPSAELKKLIKERS